MRDDQFKKCNHGGDENERINLKAAADWLGIVHVLSIHLCSKRALLILFDHKVGLHCSTSHSPRNGAGPLHVHSGRLEL